MSLMLAHPYSTKIDTTNWLWSEKLDGVRAEFRNGKIYSRNNKPIYAPQWWIDQLPINANFDGELFVGRGLFQKTVSFVKKYNPRDEEWKQVRYLVFDNISLASQPFKERLESIPINVRLPHYPVVDIDKHFQEILVIKGEGIMLRCPNAQYERKRSWKLLKLKPEHTMNVVVIGYENGKGKHNGRVGALNCQLLNGKQVYVGTGLSDYQRENPPKIGSIIQIAFQELTLDGIPRFPVFIL